MRAFALLALLALLQQIPPAEIIPPEALVSSPAAVVVADFTCAPTAVGAFVDVTCTDASTGTPTSWLWQFGDGGTSTAQNPTHAYSAGGTYSVTLTATNRGGSNAKIRAAYITVTAFPAPIHWWHHEEATGTGDRVDAIGTANLAATGSVSSITGQSGNGSLTVAGTSFLASSTWPGLTGPLEITGDLTLSFWIQPAATPSESHFYDGSGGIVAGIMVDFGLVGGVGGELAVAFADPVLAAWTTAGSSAYTVGNWALVVVRYKASTKTWTARWYGLTAGNATNYDVGPLTNALTDGGTFLLGKDITTAPFFPAQAVGLDEMGYWNVRLTDSQCDVLQTHFYPF